MSQNHPLVSINLLSWNGQKYIKDCLNSVFDQTHPNLEVSVIDNGSTDKTIDYLEEIKGRHQNLKIISKNSENVGFAAAHNRLIEKSKGEFVICLNQDIVLDKDFIERALEVFKSDIKIGAVQGKLLRWQKGLSISQNHIDYQVAHIIDTTGLVILKNRRIINRGQGDIDQGQFEKIEEIFGVDGAAPVYRKETLENIRIDQEYFDESFFSYKEDVDLAWRLRLYGWKVVYQPQSIAWHDRTSGDSMAIGYLSVIKERLKISKFAKYLAFKNQRLMQIKNEQISLLIKHLIWFLPKEIISWLYVLFLERYTWRAIKDLFQQIPEAWRKRKIIMAKKRVTGKEMEKWFA
jgi:GT2 family glycosyltransferase|tara:strand:+ start:6515 stop:7558 length:1044 start_codon:yes stop_codon:yes gene_type:complete